MKKLVNIDDSGIDQFIGIYQNEKPAIEVRIRVMSGFLELNIHKEDKRFERMFATKPNTFFLKSSPSSHIEFKGTDPHHPDLLEVNQIGKVIISAKKQ